MTPVTCDITGNSSAVSCGFTIGDEQVIIPVLNGCFAIGARMILLMICMMYMCLMVVVRDECREGGQEGIPCHPSQY